MQTCIQNENGKCKLDGEVCHAHNSRPLLCPLWGKEMEFKEEEEFGIKIKTKGMTHEEMYKLSKRIEALMKGESATCSECGGQLICFNCDLDTLDETVTERAQAGGEAKGEAHD